MIKIPGMLERLDHTLWHSLVLPPGVHSGSKFFFTAKQTDTPPADANVFEGGLPYPRMFRIHRVSLMPSLDSLPSDANTLIGNSTFSFEMGGAKNYLEGPAQNFYKGSSKDLDLIFKDLKKLPKKTQQAILEKMKIPDGMKLSSPYELLPQQVFRAKLETIPIKLKKHLKITCMLEGHLLREVC